MEMLAFLTLLGMFTWWTWKRLPGEMRKMLAAPVKKFGKRIIPWN